MIRVFLICSFIQINVMYSQNLQEPVSEKVLKRIAFGSCAFQNRPQPIWETIVAKSPELFLFIGDNIYGDSEDMEVLKSRYAQLSTIAGYQKLLKTTELLSVWDDHDYGVNDGGVHYPKKKESQKVFLDFFNVDQNSPRRKREGIYGSKIFGSPGKKVQVILLDTRYFKDDQVANKENYELKKQKNLVGWYSPTTDTNTTILGKDQWQWLEKELRKDADVRIIASSIQVVSHEKGMECWGNFPHERKLLFNLIDKTNANGVVFISGDVHFAEISKTNEGPYSLYDFTSSGLTNSSEEWAGAVNNYRVGNSYSPPNFGFITIDWGKNNQMITMQTISVDGKVQMKQKISLKELRK